MKKVLIIVVVFALSFGFLTLINNKGSNTASVQETLTGTAEGFGGPINVTVVVKGDDIISVEAVGDNETEGIGTMALEKLPNLIAEADSAEIDGVAGATYSSDGIKAAVKNALAAKGNSDGQEELTLTGEAEGFGGPITVTVVVKGDDIISVEAAGDNETDGIGTMALEKLPDLIAEADSTEIDGVTGATYSSDGIKAAVKNALESK